MTNKMPIPAPVLTPEQVKVSLASSNLSLAKSKVDGRNPASHQAVHDAQANLNTAVAELQAANAENL